MADLVLSIHLHGTFIGTFRQFLGCGYQIPNRPRNPHGEEDGQRCATGDRPNAQYQEIAPGLTRVAVMRDAAIASQMGLLGAMQSLAPSLRIQLRPIDMRDAGDIERAIIAFADEPNGGLIVPSSARGLIHRDLIISLAARHRLPAIYAYRIHVASGGLISYGIDSDDQFRRAAGYVDRILKGEKPADLPVQNPTKYELVINVKAAKALGLDVPPTLLARADEVIE